MVSEILSEIVMTYVKFAISLRTFTDNSIDITLVHKTVF